MATARSISNVFMVSLLVFGQLLLVDGRYR
jgi:hypothetical protein